MKSVYYEKVGDFFNLKKNLMQCLQLDPSLKEVKVKLIMVIITNNTIMHAKTNKKKSMYATI